MAHSPQNRTGTFQCIRLKHWTTPLRGTTGRGSTGPRHPLRSAVAPLALGSTWTVLRQSRRPKIGEGRTTGAAARVRSALPPEPVGCRFTSANTRGKSARFRAGYYLNPYPARYRPAFASSLVLYPPPRRLTLRRGHPRGGATGFPPFIARNTLGVGP